MSLRGGGDVTSIISISFHVVSSQHQRTIFHDVISEYSENPSEESVDHEEEKRKNRHGLLRLLDGSTVCEAYLVRSVSEDREQYQHLVRHDEDYSEEKSYGHRCLKLRCVKSEVQLEDHHGVEVEADGHSLFS